MIQPVGTFYSWWRGDAVPRLPPLVEFTITPDASADLLAGLPEFAPDDAHGWQRQGHRLYLARLGPECVAWGWVATEAAAIGELGVDVPLPPGNRYLWGFITRSEWRGRGIYPRLLQAILRQEADAGRFWIGHDTANVASARGILRAGFQPAGQVYPDAAGSLWYQPSGPRERSDACEALFGITAHPAG